MDTIPADASNRTVYVTNISPTATEKKLADFFTFCGALSQITLVTTPGQEAQSAFIVFATPEAAETALLLTNAHIVDRAIKVQLFTEAGVPLPGTGSGASATTVNADQIQQRDHSAPDAQRSKTSVIASLFAAGYSLGDDVVRKAREYDEHHSITAHVKVGADIVKAKIQQVDQQFGISDKAATVRDAAILGVQRIDDNLKISDKATSIAQSFTTTMSDFANRAMQNENIAKGVNKISTTITEVKTTIQTKIDAEKSEIKQAIEEKQREKGTHPDQQPQSAAPSSGDELGGSGGEMMEMTSGQHDASAQSPAPAEFQQQQQSNPSLYPSIPVDASTPAPQ
jgi:RNA recognition motif-containing protein